MHVDVCRSRAEWTAVLQSDGWRSRWLHEQALAARISRWRPLRLRGHCRVCDRGVTFRTDSKHARRSATGWEPSWRNRQICSSCGMIARHRRAAEFLLARADGKTAIYLTEQSSRLFAWCRGNLGANGTVVGSEYFGDGAVPGEQVGALRHEDVQALSFPDASFDLVVSCDVLEHVPDPGRALRELHRVLQPRGTLFLTVPFGGVAEANRTRARVVAGGGIEHILPPEYHHDPVAKRRGVLVYTDFGWQLLHDLRAVGFRDAFVELYWSLDHGHLGIPSSCIVAER